MARYFKLSKFAALVATIPLIAPGAMPSASAKDPARPRLMSKTQVVEPKPTDIVLHPGNIIAGEVFTADGKPLAETEVIVQIGRHEVARVSTNRLGEFAVEVPRGGVYVVASNGGTLLVRAWTATAAPPTSLEKITIAPQTTVIRAQNQGGGFDPLLGLLLAGGIAAAIAIPIALNNSGNNDAPKSNTRTNPGDNGNNIPQSP
ncbi:MAG: hypothetical protein NT013_18815 [Planctomycetia bacterium]|nr:hypothetical protein [Planctomycetia bacterium]